MKNSRDFFFSLLLYPFVGDSSGFLSRESLVAANPRAILGWGLLA